MRIIPNPASQRTFNENISSVLLNKEHIGIRYIVWRIDNIIYLGTMNTDGTNWVSNTVVTLPYDIEYYPIVCHIYNGDIIIYANIITDEDVNKTAVIKFDLNGDNVTYNIIFDYYPIRIYLDLEHNEVRYIRPGIGGIWIGFSDFYGNNYTENQFTARTFGSLFEIVRVGNKLLYFFRVSITLYVAQSDLDCTNFVQMSTSKGIQNMGFVATDGSYAYTTFFTQDTFGICKVSSVTSTTTDFSFIETTSIGFTYFDMFKENGELYIIESSQDESGINSIVVGTCDLGLSNFSEESYVVGGFIGDVRVDVSEEYYTYVWLQENESGIYDLWTYPGDYIEPIEPVLPLPSPHPWPMVGQNYSNTCASPYQFSNKLSEKWRTQLDDYILSLLISENNTMYACLYNGKVVSLTSEGNINWTYETNDPTLRIPVRSGIIGANNNIYVSSDDGNIIALNTSGELVWKVLLDDVTNGFIGGFTNNNGTLYFVESNKLHSLDYNGNVKWTFNAYTDSLSILDDNGTIYINDYVYNTLYALNYDGSVKWQKVGLGQTYSLSVAPNGNIYFMQYNTSNYGNLIVLDPTDGNEIWRYALNNNGISYSTAIDYSNNYYFTYNDSLGTGFIIIDSNGIVLFNSRQLNNQIIYYYMNKILLDSNGTVYINGYNSTNAVITYNLYTSVYEINIVNDYFDANGFSMNNGNYLYAYCSGGEIIAFEKYTPILPQVQCRATQIIASANTGKIILSVPIL